MHRFDKLESSLLSRLRVGVFACDPDGTVRWANAAFLQILQAVEPTTPNAFSWRDSFHDKTIFDHHVRQLDTEGGPVEFLAELRTGAGETIWADVRLARVTNDSGASLEGLMSDATARTLATMASQAELARTDRLTTMGELAAGLAHEVNQSLGAIANYAGACLPALEKADFAGAEQAREWVTRISEQALRAGDVIRSFNRFLDRHKTSRVPLPLTQVVAESLRLVHFELLRSKTSVACQIADVDVLVDRVLIQQVLVNLVRNAIEAAEQGGGERRTIRIHAVEHAGWAEIEVQDQGPGIAEDVRDTLLKPFVTTKPDGLGMGLAVCARIVESHLGRLTVSSSSNGAVFRFTLPLAADSA